MTIPTELIDRLAREAGLQHALDLQAPYAKVMMPRFAQLVAAHCCRTVHGMAGSDNDAQRIVDALRKEFGIDPD